MAKVAINGFGRIGRAAFKIILDTPELELVGVNDIMPLDNLAYLLKYDTAYGRYEKNVETGDSALIVDGKEYKFFAERDPAQLPWGELDLDIVFECTGFFATEEGLKKHLEAGAKFAILSAPTESEGVPTIVHGVNVPEDESIPYLSCASCTTNCITPVVEVMKRRIGVENAIMTTIHAYTSTQAIVDGPSKKVRRGRAAAANFVPTSTGAAIATTKVLPELEGRFDGVAVRAPIPVGSISDIIFVTTRETSVEEVNDIFREEAASDRYKGILGVAEDPIVSSDIIGDSRASIVDVGMTQVVNGTLVKIMSWYDNEWGFTSQMVREGVRVAKTL
ncbi:MAG: type I glyceraldehyde-3-phosphate dehydrogenase [Chloroflexota bacterium]|nr:type I glyceraldehyde-3-phosphate dehydrogenase [Chloroflexota bacterium]